MGVLIYVNGEVETDAPESVMKKLLDIKNDRGEKAFERTDRNVISFRFDTMEGSYDPFTRLVYGPLVKLAEAAKKNGVSLEGCIEVSSDWADYDNIYVDVSEKGLETGNREVRDASTEELVKELVKRGVRMEDLISIPAVAQFVHNWPKGDSDVQPGNRR